MTEKITSYKFACAVARFLDEKIAKDISILNISNVSSFADYFVICSAQTNTQVKALTENLADKVKTTFGRLPIGRENDMKNRPKIRFFCSISIFIIHLLPLSLLAFSKSFSTVMSITLL